MRPIFLIAVNFLRESRWAILLLLLWVVLSSAASAFSLRESKDDALFWLKQQTVYGVVFTTFLASSAIYNQRRSRRILAVLAKAISRAQYLAGLEFGFLSAAVVYCVALAGLSAWVFVRAELPAAQIFSISLMLFAASALAGSLALLFSTFLNPLFSISLTAILIGINGVVVETSAHHLTQLMPAYLLMRSILSFSFEPGWMPEWGAIVSALIQSVAIWAIASVIFWRRDLAVAIE